MANVTVSSGRVNNRTYSSGTVFVKSGGTYAAADEGAFLSGSATVTISSGGLAGAPTVIGAGVGLIVSSGGSVQNLTMLDGTLSLSGGVIDNISAGMAGYVSNGGSHIVVNGYPILNNTGGTVLNADIKRGTFFNGLNGTSFNVTISSGVLLQNNGLLSGGTIQGIASTGGLEVGTAYSYGRDWLGFRTSSAYLSSTHANGVMSDYTVESGGSFVVYGSYYIPQSGGVEQIRGTADNIHVSNGGTVINNGALSNVDVHSGGFISAFYDSKSVFNYGSGWITDITADGGTVAVGNGGTLLGRNNVFASGAVLSIGSQGSIESHARVDLENGGTAIIGTGGTVGNGIDWNSDDSARVSAALNVSDGGKVIVQDVSNQAIVTLAGAGTVQINNIHADDANYSNPGITIMGWEKSAVFGFGGRVLLEGIDKKTIGKITYSDDGNAVTFWLVDPKTGVAIKTFDQDGNERQARFTLNIPGVSKTGYRFDVSDDGSSIFEVCFLAGTLIKTPGGDVPVEDLRPGDMVIVLRDGMEVAEPLIWVGQKDNVFNPYLPDDRAGYPVRVLKNALAENVPNKDLLLTPEHCLYLDGGFVPVRQLVNGRSIFYDYDLTQYTYYHLETEQHGILMSDGALSESFLNTGNRDNFGNRNIPDEEGLIEIVKTWQQDAAAPLLVGREIIESLYLRLTARADSLNISKSRVREARLVAESDLHLVTESGEEIYPRQVRNNWALFDLRTIEKSVRLRSRISRPVDIEGPYVDDRRFLGVLVEAIRFFEGIEEKNIEIFLKEEDLSGWNNLEVSSMRWTAGNALIPLPAVVDRLVPLVLAVKIIAGGPYMEDSDFTPEKVLEIEHLDDDNGFFLAPKKIRK